MYHLVTDQAEDMELSSDIINGLKVNLYMFKYFSTSIPFNVTGSLHG